MKPRRGFSAALPAQPPLAGRAAFYGLLLLLAWLPLPWGSHRPWAAHLFVLWAALLLVLACLGRAGSGGRLPRRYRWAALLWLPWLAWIGFQTLSLPAARLAAWSPQAAALHAAARPASSQPPLDSLSIMPAATLDALLLSLGYFALYLVVALTCRERARRRLVAGVLVLAGLIQAVYGSLMTLSGAEIGFLAHKTFYQGYATGTFVNRNHLAAYLELTAAAGLGLVLADLKAGGAGSWRLRLSGWIELAFSTKMRVRIALGVMVIALVLTRSRMGNTAFFAALTVTGLAYVLLRERRLFLRALLLFGSLLAVDTLIVSHWFGLEQVVGRIEATRLEQEGRPLVYRELPQLLAQYRATGSGLGSFAQAFMPQRPAQLKGYYDHAHNDYMEFLVETGVPGLSLVLLLAGVHLLHALRVAWKREDRLPQGICVGFVMASIALGLHATVEFNFQIPAIAASYVALMGLVLSCSQGGDKRLRARSAQDAAAAAPEVGPTADASVSGSYYPSAIPASTAKPGVGGKHMQRLNISNLGKGLGALALGWAFLAVADGAGPAGKFDAVGGPVVVSHDVDPQGAAPGSTVNAGDTVHVGDSGSARLRMADGAVFQLGSSTVFDITDYRYSGTGAYNESRAPATARYRLKDGSLRTISGSIGKERGDSEMIAADQADVRPHGTDYSLQESGGLLVIVYSGSVSVTNDTGSIELSTGQYVYVASRHSPLRFKSTVDLNGDVTVPTIIRLPPIPVSPS